MLRLGIDIGATKTHGVVLDDKNKVVAEEATFTQTGPEGVVAVLMAIATKVAEDVGVSTQDFASVGVGIPGVVDQTLGVVTSAVNLRIERLGLADLVADMFSVPVKVDNDVKATVVGAARLLNCDSVTYLNIGTGISSATIEGGIFRGSSNMAGEIGHLVIDPNGTVCRCGQRGCVETLIGGRYIAARMNLLGLDWTTLDQDTRHEAVASLDQVVRAAARTISMLALAYDSSKIVVGGGVVQAAPWLIGSVHEFLVARASTVSFPDFHDIAWRIATVPEEDRVAPVGAALMGML